MAVNDFVCFCKQTQTMKYKLLIIIAAALCIGNFAQAQQTIPNASFENWTNFGTYSDPTSWKSLNSQTFVTGLFTCEKGTPGAVGASYLKLTVKGGPGATIPALLESANSLNNNGKSPSGFEYNLRPTSFTGKWQYLVTDNDSLLAGVQFTKWNPVSLKSDLIGTGLIIISAGIVSSWTNFSIPITYISSSIPDSALILFFLGTGTFPVVNDYLYIDDLAFSGTVAVNEVQDNYTFSVFPNPSNGVFTIQNIDEDLKNIDVFNLLGEKVFQSANTNLVNNNETAIDLSTKPKGIYFIQVTNGKSITTKKIVVE